MSGLVKTILFGVAFLAILAVPALSAWRLGQSSATLAAARTQLESAARDGREIAELRATTARIAEDRRPEQDMIALVQTALADAGIPVSGHFLSLLPDSDAPVPDRPRYRRQAVTVALSQLDPPSLGAFLAVWRRANPLWIPARLELSHPQGPDNTDRFDVTITFSAIYLAPPPPPPATTPTQESASS